MKKLLACLLALGCLAPALSAGEKFSIRISAGLAAISPTDLNDFLGDYVRLIRDSGATILGGGFKTLRLSDEFEISVWVPLDSRLSVFVSAGLIGAARSENSFDFAMSSGAGTYRRDDRIRAVVGRLGLAYAIPLSVRLNLRPHASLDAYWSSFHDAGSEDFGSTGFESQTEYEWTANADAFNFGFTGGLGLDWALWSRLSLSLDAGFRGAKLTRFDGVSQLTTFGSPEAPRNFRLIYSEQPIDWLSSAYKMLNLPATFGGSTIGTLRDAVLDLSGLYFTAGLRISF